MSAFFYLFLVPFLITQVLLFFGIPLLSLFILDSPDHRSSHISPTPSSGGLVFVLVSFFTLLYTSSSSQYIPSAFILLLLLSFVGLFDDFRDLSPFIRLFFHFFFSSLIIPLTPFFLSNFPSYGHFTTFFFVLLLFLFVASINLSNFMDGLDGLLAGCFFIIVTTCVYYLSLPLPFLSLSASLLAFLFWNWSPAKVFMGDIGSTFLGAILGYLVLQTSDIFQLFSLLFIAFPLLADSLSCIIRRFVSGQNIFTPHNLHLYQRLYRSGLSHSLVAFLYVLSTSILSLSLLIFGPPALFIASFFLFISGVCLDKFVAVPFTA